MMTVTFFPPFLGKQENRHWGNMPSSSFPTTLPPPLPTIKSLSIHTHLEPETTFLPLPTLPHPFLALLPLPLYTHTLPCLIYTLLYFICMYMLFVPFSFFFLRSESLSLCMVDMWQHNNNPSDILCPTCKHLHIACICRIFGSSDCVTPFSFFYTLSLNGHFPCIPCI